MQNNFLKDFISFDSNLLYYGKQGSGSSCNLYLLSMWAYENNCV